MLDNQRETLLKEYLNVVLLVDYLQDKYQNIILWGRLMGATNSLMYTLKHQNIHCLILDSPFIDLEEIIINLIKDKLDTPNLINKGLFEIIKSMAYYQQNNQDGFYNYFNFLFLQSKYDNV
ncbi:unnamed protein product [Paramecium primaurelia]|uniref:Uncharacterized protein n=1 Tax=Paramecium primaurelia TaxID=5886 RepID=A0A8S1QKK8_PARPR|nr:unnamed protein product [Paramecium primaurelia]